MSEKVDQYMIDGFSVGKRIIQYFNGHSESKKVDRFIINSHDQPINDMNKASGSFDDCVYSTNSSRTHKLIEGIYTKYNILTGTCTIFADGDIVRQSRLAEVSQSDKAKLEEYDKEFKSAVLAHQNEGKKIKEGIIRLYKANSVIGQDYINVVELVQNFEVSTDKLYKLLQINHERILDVLQNNHPDIERDLEAILFFQKFCFQSKNRRMANVAEGLKTLGENDLHIEENTSNTSKRPFRHY